MAFEATLAMQDDAAVITLIGELDAAAAPAFKERIETAAKDHPKHLVLIMNGLNYMASAGLRALVFAKQKMGGGVDIIVVGVQDTVRETIELTGFHHSVSMVDSYTGVDA